MAAVLDLVLRAIAKLFETFRFANPVLALASYVLLDALSGGLSLLVFPHPLVHPSRLHGINLLVSPTATGLAMSLIGSMLSRQDKKVTRKFWLWVCLCLRLCLRLRLRLRLRNCSDSRSFWILIFLKLTMSRSAKWLE